MAEPGWIDDPNGAVERDILDPEEVQAAERDDAKIAADREAAARQEITRRKEAYRRLFAHADQADLDIVMNDLTTFCRGYGTTFHENPQISARLDGRREVWLRIADYTSLSVDTLFIKYNTQVYK